jgi:thymidylate kinase
MLDIDPERGLKRIHTRGAGQDLFETLEELTKARAIFRSIVEPHVNVIDGARAPDVIHGDVLRSLLALPPLARFATSAAR